MTEELKQKGIKYACEYPTSYGKGYKRVDLRKAYIAGATEETKELQEEINEWKTKFENLQKYLDTRNCYRECAETWGKLTEAKEIIKEILSRPDGETSYETRAKAEAFIKEQTNKTEEDKKELMYFQRERNELGADYLAYQGYHPRKN